MTECCTGKKPKHFFRDKGLGMMSFEKEKKICHYKVIIEGMA